MPENDPNELKAAYEQILPALRAIPEKDVKKPRVDMATTAAFVLAALPKVEKHREALLALPLTDKTLLDELPVRAKAMMHLFGDLSATAAPSGAVAPALIAEATEVRARLLLAADFLVGIGALSASTIAEVRDGTGFADLGRDLLTLGSVFANQRAVVERETPSAVRFAERATGLGKDVLMAVGDRAQPATTPELVQLRDRAYTHFLAAYDNVRQGVAYLRGPHGDAEKILPSIFTSSRTKRGDGPEPAPVDGGPSPLPPSPMSVAVNGGGGAVAPQDPDSPFVT